MASRNFARSRTKDLVNDTPRPNVDDKRMEVETIEARRQAGDLTEGDIDQIAVALRSSLPCSSMDQSERKKFAELFYPIKFEPQEKVCVANTLGSYFFVLKSGEAQVEDADGKVINTIAAGSAFGEIALLQSCPRTATVVAKGTLECWAVHSEEFRKCLHATSSRKAEDTRKALDHVKIFDELTEAQKTSLSHAFIVQVYAPGTPIFQQGDPGKALYILQHGELQVTIDGEAKRKLQAGAYFGERALLYEEKRSATVTTLTSCECALVEREKLEDVFGNHLETVLFQNVLVYALTESKKLGRLTADQHKTLARGATFKDIHAGATLEPKDLAGVRRVVGIEGTVDIVHINGGAPTALSRGQIFGDDIPDSDKKFDYKIKAGAEPAKIAVFTADCLATCLHTTGDESLDSALDHAARATMLKHVHIFASLNKSAIDVLAKQIVRQIQKKGDIVFSEGEMGTRLFIIHSGRLLVSIGGKELRTLSKGDYFGERALLFDEARSATVTSDSDCEIWSLDKTSFLGCIEGNMKDYMEYRIQIQNTRIDLSDLKPVKTIGSGSFGVVQQVQHSTTKVRYALKAVSKKSVKDLSQEMSIMMERRILMEVDHPFILKLVRTFKDGSYIYFLTELVTGGELYAAIRQLGLLEVWEAQFYLANILLAVSYLAEKWIVFRDLKPENILLDKQGYCKIIDFGCARRLQEGERAYTLVGTPYYMAPEVILGSGHTTDADIWSTGVLAYELLCGPLPFGNATDDKLEIFREVVNKKVEFVNCDDAASISMLKALLHRKPARRIGSHTRGTEEIWAHPYFRANGFTLDQLMARKLTAPDPWLGDDAEVYSDAVDPNQKIPPSPAMVFDWEKEF